MPLICRNCGYSRTTSTPGTACPICNTPYPESDLESFSGEQAAPYERAGKIIAIIIYVAIFSGAYFLLFGRDKPERLTLEDRFYNALDVSWSDEYHAGITQTLIARSVRGCGSFRYKQSPGEPGTFLVECSDQHNNLTLYRVTPDPGYLQGPARY